MFFKLNLKRLKMKSKSKNKPINFVPHTNAMNHFISFIFSSEGGFYRNSGLCLCTGAEAGHDSKSVYICLFLKVRRIQGILQGPLGPVGQDLWDSIWVTFRGCWEDPAPFAAAVPGAAVLSWLQFTLARTCSFLDAI